MSSFALIDPDGVVVNVISKAPETEIFIQDEWILVDITELPVGKGCIYEGDEFVCPD